MPENKSQEHVDGEMDNAYGSIKISEEALAAIVSYTLSQIRGIASMPAGFMEKLGKKDSSKGVKLELSEQEVSVALQLVVDYGVRIPALALEIQNTVRDSIEQMTGLKVKEVNIYVQGISFDRSEESADWDGERTESEE